MLDIMFDLYVTHSSLFITSQFNSTQWLPWRDLTLIKITKYLIWINRILTNRCKSWDTDSHHIFWLVSNYSIEKNAGKCIENPNGVICANYKKISVSVITTQEQKENYRSLRSVSQSLVEKVVLWGHASQSLYLVSKLFVIWKVLSHSHFSSSLWLTHTHSCFQITLNKRTP